MISAVTLLVILEARRLQLKFLEVAIVNEGKIVFFTDQFVGDVRKEGENRMVVVNSSKLLEFGKKEGFAYNEFTKNLWF